MIGCRANVSSGLARRRTQCEIVNLGFPLRTASRVLLRNHVSKRVLTSLRGNFAANWISKERSLRETKGKSHMKYKYSLFSNTLCIFALSTCLAYAQHDHSHETQRIKPAE